MILIIIVGFGVIFFRSSGIKDDKGKIVNQNNDLGVGDEYGVRVDLYDKLTGKELDNDDLVMFLEGVKSGNCNRNCNFDLPGIVGYKKTFKVEMLSENYEAINELRFEDRNKEESHNDQIGNLIVFKVYLQPKIKGFVKDINIAFRDDDYSLIWKYLDPKDKKQWENEEEFIDLMQKKRLVDWAVLCTKRQVNSIDFNGIEIEGFNETGGYFTNDLNNKNIFIAYFNYVRLCPDGLKDDGFERQYYRTEGDKFYYLMNYGNEIGDGMDKSKILSLIEQNKLYLQKKVKVTGWVKDYLTGEPVTGAKVELIGDYYIYGEYFNKDVFEKIKQFRDDEGLMVSYTDSDGYFEINDVYFFPSKTVKISKEGYSSGGNENILLPYYITSRDVVLGDVYYIGPDFDKVHDMVYQAYNRGDANLLWDLMSGSGKNEWSGKNEFDKFVENRKLINEKIKNVESYSIEVGPVEYRSSCGSSKIIEKVTWCSADGTREEKQIIMNNGSYCLMLYNDEHNVAGFYRYNDDWNEKKSWVEENMRVINNPDCNG